MRRSLIGLVAVLSLLSSGLATAEARVIGRSQGYAVRQVQRPACAGAKSVGIPRADGKTLWDLGNQMGAWPPVR